MNALSVVTHEDHERFHEDCAGCQADFAAGVQDYYPSYVQMRMNAMRCQVCGHRLDDMDGCDSCAADREAAEADAMDDDGPDNTAGGHEHWGDGF